jgi:NAD(P)-dependent dehydrogenase (short-subunit alcohol dehydrogenase family)
MVSKKRQPGFGCTLFAFLAIMLAANTVKSWAVAVAASQRPTALITGSTDGIGLTTAKHLAAKKGYNVVVHGRDPKRIERACEEIQTFVNEWANEEVLVLPVQADLQTVRGCESLATQVHTICQEKGLTLSVLMNNAGVYASDFIVTPDGTEQTFAVNVLAPFVVTSMLLPLLLQQPSSRIVMASSVSQSRSIRDWDDLHYDIRPYSAHGAYAESKLMDAMLTFDMAGRLIHAGIGTERLTCNCLDPGTVNTKMLLTGWGPIGIGVQDALDEAWLCSSHSDEVKDATGQYFAWKTPRRASGAAYDRNEQDRLWTMLAELAPEAAKMWNV